MIDIPLQPYGLAQTAELTYRHMIATKLWAPLTRIFNKRLKNTIRTYSYGYGHKPWH